MTHGVIFGFEPAGRICGNSRMYYFGRSKQTVLQDQKLLDDEVMQKDMLIRRLKFSGLNRPKKILFWLKVDGDLDVNQMWDEIKDALEQRQDRPEHHERVSVRRQLVQHEYAAGAFCGVVQDDGAGGGAADPAAGSVSFANGCRAPRDF